MQRSNPTQLTPKKRSLIFVNLVVSGLASSTLATAMTTALPNLVADFGVSTDIGQWVTSGYSLAMGVVMPLTAFLITRFPTKRLYMAGIGSFLIGLLLSIFAGNFGVMMAGRVIQACGNGILLSAAQVVILTVYPPGETGGHDGNLRPGHHRRAHHRPHHSGTDDRRLRLAVHLLPGAWDHGGLLRPVRRGL